MKIMQLLTVVGVGCLLWAGVLWAEPKWEVTAVKPPPGADDGLKEIPLRQRFALGPVTNPNLKAEILLVEGSQRRSVALVPVLKDSIKFRLQLPSADFNRVQVDYQSTEKVSSSAAVPVMKPVVEKRFEPQLRYEENKDITLAVLKCADGSVVSVVFHYR
jgi:hypothetical protein